MKKGLLWLGIKWGFNPVLLSKCRFRRDSSRLPLSLKHDTTTWHFRYYDKSTSYAFYYRYIPFNLITWMHYYYHPHTDLSFYDNIFKKYSIVQLFIWMNFHIFTQRYRKYRKPYPRHWIRKIIFISNIYKCNLFNVW